MGTHKHTTTEQVMKAANRKHPRNNRIEISAPVLLGVLVMLTLLGIFCMISAHTSPEAQCAEPSSYIESRKRNDEKTSLSNAGFAEYREKMRMLELLKENKLLRAPGVADIGGRDSKPATSPAKTEDGKNGRTFAMTADTLGKISSSQNIEAFSLGGDTQNANGATAESEIMIAKGAEIANAYAAMRHRTDACGFLILDADSGRGISHDIDAVFYSASTIKILGACHALESLEREGRLPHAREGLNGTVDGVVGEDALADIDYYTQYILALIEPIILYSDNTAYEMLRCEYADEAYNELLSEIGIEGDIHRGTDYAWISVRDLAKMWAHVGAYMKSGSWGGTWLSELTAETEVSFIRDGLNGDGNMGDDEGYEDSKLPADTNGTREIGGENSLIVRNKAGWCDGFDGDECASTCDGGFVEVDGKRFLVIVMSDMGADGESEELVSGVVKALVEAMRG